MNIFPSIQGSAEKMWEQAEENMAKVLERDDPMNDELLDDQRDMVISMQKDMIRLRERYKHDTEKQEEITRDRMDYTNAVYEIKGAISMIQSVGSSKINFDTAAKNKEDYYIVVQEIAKRVEGILGRESYSKIVFDKFKNSENPMRYGYPHKEKKTPKKVK